MPLNYHPDQWGAPECGYQFYDCSYDFVRASRVTWISRKQTEYFFASMHHVWARLVSSFYLHTSPFSFNVFSQDGNSEVYNEAFVHEAFKIKESKIPLSGKADWECRHYLHRKALARGLRLYLIESEMRSLNQTWVFPIYSAYNDNAYNEQLIKIDEFRIRVFSVNNKLNN